MKLKTIFFALAYCFSLVGFAQQKNDAAIFKQFVSMSNVYKQLPLQLTLQYKKTSNLPIAEEDTANYTADFFIQKEGAYMRFGDAEQLINDSLVLMIMHSIKQMVVMENNVTVDKMLQAIISPTIPDSAADKFLEEYTILQKNDKNQGLIHITHKRKIFATELPYQETILSYDVKTNMPQKIVTITRSLVHIAADTEVDAGFQVITLEDKRKYVLKEDNTEFVYKSIAHKVNQKLPNVIADRIIKDDENNYVPVKAYENYFVTQH